MSETEPELGLGTVNRSDGRYVDITFTTRETSRRYSIAGAPLTRIVFKAGDTIHDKSGVPLTVTSIYDDAVTGLVTYTCGTVTITEDKLSDTVNTATPIQRLLSGFIARAEDFDLRYDALDFKAKILCSPVRGFVGGRIDLLPHQLNIAETVSSRKITRALLADETGLGKTIEACLVLHRLMVTGRVCRCLIVVPEHLVHQWFVELLRRFNCSFTIFSKENCVPGSDGPNPFLREMTGICSIDLLSKIPELGALAADASWDLVIVDEAHHLQQDGPAFDVVKRLSERSQGLLLLTATPEQLGRQSHFARLQLLDPHRYVRYDAYEKENETLQRISRLVEDALCDRNKGEGSAALDSCEIEIPHDLLCSMQEKIPGATQEVPGPMKMTLEQVIDFYGTGRIMFRNTRQVISGFPQRSVNVVPLPGTEEIRRRICTEVTGDMHLHSVPILPDDPRIIWLVRLLKENAHKKVLVICTSKDKAIGIAEASLRLCTVKIALFHEDMTIIQRDRNAAWFAEEDGARMLVCSEIGSEGRNFQFCQCLVLFDLPLHPELVEQRIGRLDRIGQKSVIHLYVPYVRNTFHETLIRWYHEGLDVFSRNVPAAGLVFEALHDRLVKAFDGPPEELNVLIHDARQLRDEFMEQHLKARDSLFNLASFQPVKSQQLIDQIGSTDQSSMTGSMMERLFKHYGIVIEEAGRAKHALLTEYLTDSGFPLPRGERPVITYDRQTALAREDVEFITIDHPMVIGSLDLFLSSDQGTTSFVVWEDPGIQDILLESIYIVECIAPAYLNSDRFLPPLPLRLVVNNKGEDTTKMYSSGLLRLHCKNGPAPLFHALCKTKNTVISRMFDKSNASAHELSLPVISNAIQAMQSMLDKEIGRMLFLRERNGTTTRAEIECLFKEKTELEKYLAASTVRLDSVRLIFRGPSEETGKK
jgi:Superfamily II DNA/RNA helicases, SNF2 family